MPLVPALVLFSALGACFAYGAVAAEAVYPGLRTVRELCWALLISWLGSPAQRRRLRTVLLARQAAAIRPPRRCQAPAPPKQLLRQPGGQFPLASRQDLERAKARVRQDYRLSRRQVEDAWRQAELSPTAQFQLGMISREELRAQCPPSGGIGIRLCGREEPGGG